jgi:hypothetical protein
MDRFIRYESLRSMFGGEYSAVNLLMSSGWYPVSIVDEYCASRVDEYELEFLRS